MIEVSLAIEDLLSKLQIEVNIHKRKNIHKCVAICN